MSTTRTRERSTMTPTFLLYEREYGGGSVTSTLVPSRVYEGMVERIVDTVTPEFQKLRKVGEIVNNDCGLTRTGRTVRRGTMYQPYENGFGITVSGDLACSFVDPWAQTAQIPSNSLGMECLIKAYAKMNTSPLLMGENLAEVGQTVEMLRRPFGSAVKLLQKIVKAKRRHLTRTGGNVAKANANAWLEQRYGWGPIIGDCKEIIKQTHRAIENANRYRLVARAGGKLESTKTSHLDPLVLYPGLGIAGSSSSKQTLKCGAGVFYDIINMTSADEYLGVLGLRGRDIVPTAWELSHLSYVVDWFVNIGDWLQAVTPVPYIVVRDNWVTLVTDTLTICDGWVQFPDPQPLGQVYHGSLGGSTQHSLVYSRKTRVPLSFTPTRNNKSLSLFHQIDGIALLTKPIMASLQSLAH